MKRLVLSLVLVSVTSVWGASAQESQPAASVEATQAAGSAPVDAQLAAPSQPVPAPVAAPPVAAAPVTAAPVAPVAPIPLTSLPPTQRYREHQAPPPGYVLEEQARRGLIIPGVAVVGALYITGLITTGVVQNFPNKTGFLAIPVAGPWITWGTRASSCDDPESDLDSSLECEEDQAIDRLLVIDGLLQTVGAALIVTGFTWTKSIWVREDLANVNLVPGVNVAKLPGLPQPQGLSLVGRF